MKMLGLFISMCVMKWALQQSKEAAVQTTAFYTEASRTVLE
jgi:hypothetical protein